ncbi:piggyBac transposable element-derived protein 3-like [Ischnura elegans]|uniref:piggyBac transposable element-derived protein 3-like n=1 Tax=Ischnura elegans TaxID=197161 RepID=UPI001ED89397|nr:piggyBac transposable element-derived protein 3-like [Ischnura elegans]
MAERKKLRSMKIDPNDSEEILRLIEEGDESDCDELSDAEECVPQVCLTNKYNRVGADVSLPNSNEVEEVCQDESAVFNDGEALDGNIFNDIALTQRADIKWRHRSLVPFEASFETNRNQENCEKLAPLEYCLRYLPNALIQDMSEKTNMYALQHNISFKPTTPDEIKTLLGLHIMMGVLKYPRVRMYWDSAIGVDIFKHNMARDRFFQLRNNLHLVDILKKPKNTDRFWKVRPMYEVIRQRCLELDLEKKLCIDEQIIPFRGHLNVKQYVKGKPCPWGIKIFFLCGKSGLAYDFLIYQGSTTEINPSVQKMYGLGPIVVNLGVSCVSQCVELIVRMCGASAAPAPPPPPKCRRTSRQEGLLTED